MVEFELLVEEHEPFAEQNESLPVDYSAAVAAAGTAVAVEASQTKLPWLTSAELETLATMVAISITLESQPPIASVTLLLAAVAVVMAVVR